MRSCIRNERGFTIPEVIVAGTLMIILCVGTVTAFTFAVRLNRGNNLRMQALSVLQLEVEYYRSLRFTPVSPDAALAAGTYTNVRQRTAGDGRVFNITVIIADLQSAGGSPVFKQITITATPVVAENEGWLQTLNANVALQRVRSN